MKKYIEVYEYYKKLIEANQLKSGDKLPSIRQATQILSVSKTTIENAYFALQADGYIIASAKSGYYVSSVNSHNKNKSAAPSPKQKIEYDLKSGGSDSKCFDLSLWQRYIKNALRQQGRLLSYGEVQGEEDLRQALSDYIRVKRNVVASPDRIVIGAGVQSLLHILCSFLKDRKTVSFPDNSFLQGIAVFKDYGFDVHTRFKDAQIIYVSPSHMTSYGDVMPIKRRLELVQYSQLNSSIVIEDDYDNDFLYQTKPTPSLFALSSAGNVVYMGSFSNVLLPGIRISFMVLTEELTQLFKENSCKFAQTASKTEQIALCQYIRDGHINSQTRKVRRLYTQKARCFYEMLAKALPSSKVSMSENGLQVKLEAKFSKDIKCFEENGIAVNINSYDGNTLKAVFTPSALDEELFEQAILKVKSILE